MEEIFGSYYKNNEFDDRKLPDNTHYLKENNIFSYFSDEAQELCTQFQKRMESGETLYLLGLNLGHNSGISLVEASKKGGIQVLANLEEERYIAIKHFAGYPQYCVKDLKKLLLNIGHTPEDIFCILYAWDSVKEEQYGQKMLMLNGKIIKNKYYAHISEGATPTIKKETVNNRKRQNLYSHSPGVINMVRRLVADLEIEGGLPCIQLLHHENHAYFSYGVSPFYKEDNQTTMISCIDGGGDFSSTSLYTAKGSEIELVKRLSRENSLGVFYMLCASFLGGWTALSAEGRYMGAAAWGNNNRLTNPYYKRLRQFFYFSKNGEVFVNSAMAENDYAALQHVVGPFLKVEDLWNPDAVLTVDDIKHSSINKKRVDIAAAVQMVFEDAVFHIIAFLIHKTESDQLVLTGGTALNCVANMRLLENFNRDYYREYFNKDTQLHIWIPPIPSDQGVVVGAAYHFAMRNGAKPQGELPTPFLCGLPPKTDNIRDALNKADFIHYDSLGNVKDDKTRKALADWMAYVVSKNGVIGIYQGEAETGPRALGHRSLLSNPCHPDTLAILNSRVKLRERIRPLAPMMTLDDAKKWFHLSDGASNNNYDAYNYMVLTVPAKKEATSVIPAVIHFDGTSRIQIVRKENNLLIYDYLKALGKYIGVEISVNTSLNVGSPIVQSPTQALQIFKRAKGLDSIFLIGHEGDIFMAWAKEGVQEYDSNIPHLSRAYWKNEAVDKDTLFKSYFSTSLSIPTKNRKNLSLETTVDKKITIKSVETSDQKEVSLRNRKKEILLAVKEKRMSLIEAKRQIEEILGNTGSSFGYGKKELSPVVKKSSVNQVEKDIESEKNVNKTTGDLFPAKQTSLCHTNSEVNVDGVPAPIAIIGMSGRFPDAENVHQFWENLKNARNSVAEAPNDRGWNVNDYYEPTPQTPGKTYTKRGAFLNDIDKFDPLFFGISPQEAEFMDPSERIFLQESWRAIEDAGYAPSSLSGKAWSVFACAKGDYSRVIQKYHETYHLDTDSLSASRLSYILDLIGAAVTVDTACSSTMTAMTQACDSLTLKNCEVAVVGGGEIFTTPYSLIFSSQNLLLSPDGCCYTFDQRANGTVIGEAVGAVVLKPLKSAVEDKDHIYGVIRGWGINQDGKTNGITAPNVKSQIRLQTDVYKKFKINPERISMVEAHGTGTKLGDPIEVQALVESFKKFTGKKEFCALGSIKTNIGHAYFGSGIAGLIKVLLSLKHSQVPASLNFETINPLIPLKNSPFYINTSLKPWERKDNQPLCAAINSFGATGVNIHLVIEEYVGDKQEQTSSIEDNPVIIVLSAKNRDRLREAAKNLLEHIQQQTSVEPTDNQELNLSNLAYTLQVGRDAKEERLGMIASSLKEVTEKLEGFLKEKQTINDFYLGQVKRHKKVLDVFTADEDMQTMINTWIERGKHSKLLDLWVNGLALDWNSLYEKAPSRPRRISLPTYPFARERHWISGTETNTVSVYPHDSAGVPFIHPMLHQNTSDLAEQRFSSTFSGQEFFLNDHQIKGEKVLPGVAYLEMARAAVEKAAGGPDRTLLRLKNIVWSQPMVVNETPKKVHIALAAENNDRIQYEIYTDSENPGESIVHSQGVAEFKAEEEVSSLNIDKLKSEMKQGTINAETCYRAFITMGTEYGSGHQGVREIYCGDDQVLAKIILPSSIQNTLNEYVLHPSLMDAALQSFIGLTLDSGSPTDGAAITSGKSELKSGLPFALESLEISGACTQEMFAWVRRSEKQGKIQKMDVDLCDEQGNVRIKMRGFSSRELDRESESTGTKETVGTLLATPIWKETPIPSGLAQQKYLEHRVFICEMENCRANELEALVTGSKCFELLSKEQRIESRFTEYAVDCFKIIQEILKTKPQGNVLIQILVPDTGAQSLFTGLSGLLKSAGLENPKIIGQIIRINAQENITGISKKLLENRNTPYEPVIRYKQEKRLVTTFKEVINPEEKPEIAFRENGVYLITGGLGGLGIIFAREILAQTREAKIILTGRSTLSAQKESILKALQSDGRNVEYRTADVSDSRQVSSLIESIQSGFGKLNGIIHSAGVILDNYIIKKSTEEFKQVLAPKVSGTINLDRETGHLNLDLFILFSSGAGAFGSTGQADYATANAFMDHFVHYRNDLVLSNDRTGQTLSVNWPLWKEGGMKVDMSTQEMWQRSSGIVPMENETGIEAFYRGLALNQGQLMVIVGDLRKIRDIVFSDKASALPPKKADKTEIEETEVDKDIIVDQLQQMLIQTVSEMLKLRVEDIDIDAELSEFGFDSITLTKFSNQLNEKFSLELIPTIFFEYPTLEDFVRYLSEEHQNRFASEFGVKTTAAKPVEHSPVETQKISTPTKRRSRFMATPSPTIPEVKTESKDSIAIIGMSGSFPMAADIDTFWENLKAGKDCITEIPADRWDWKAIYGDPHKEAHKTNIKWGGFIDGVGQFDPLFFGISPREAKVMDPQQRLLMTYVYLAIEDAGYSPQGLSRSDTGIFAGTSNSGYSTLIEKASIAIDGYTMTGLSSSVGPNRMSYFLNIHGPSEPIETACSSSLVAIHRAVQAINNGDCRSAVVGGINTIVTPDAHIGFNKAAMLCEDGRCKTFSAQANGYVRGEGVGMLVLKKLSQAELDGDHIYAVIRSSSENHGGRANSLTAPNPVAQAELLKSAYTKAGIDPGTVGYIEAHGTGTELGDPVEINGLKMAFEALYLKEGDSHVKSTHCGLGSVKSNIGHLELAAGVAGIIKVLLQLKHKTLVKTLHCQELNPYIELKGSPFYIVQENKKWPVLKDDAGNDIPRRAGVSSFGFGGVNAHIVLEEYIPQNSTGEPSILDIGTTNPVMLPLSAKTEESLKGLIQSMTQAFKNNKYKASELNRISYTLFEGRHHFDYRCAIVVRDIKEAIDTWGKTENNDKLPNLYKGKVAKDFAGQKTITVYIKDLLDQILSNTISQVKYLEILNTLADFYCQGYDIPWQNIYGEIKPTRISLPTYHFAKDRYWIPVVKTPSTDSPAQREKLTPPLKNITISTKKTRKTDVPQTTQKQAAKVVLERDTHLTEQKTVAESPISNNEIKGKIKKLVSELLQMEMSEIDDQTSYKEYGMDSISLVELSKNLNDTFNIDIKFTVLYDYFTIDKLSAFISKTLTGKGQNAVLDNNNGQNLEKPESKPIEQSEVVQLAGDIKNINRNITEISEDLDEDRLFLNDGYGLIKNLKSKVETIADHKTVRSKTIILRPAESHFNNETPLINQNRTGFQSKPEIQRKIVLRSKNEAERNGSDSCLKENSRNLDHWCHPEESAKDDFPENTEVLHVATAPFKMTEGKTQEIENLNRIFAKTSGNSTSLDIAVIGMAGRFPGAGNIGEFWENLCHGVDSVTEVPLHRWDIKKHYDPDPGKIDKTPCKWGGFLDDVELFNPEFFKISPAEAELMDPQQRLFMEECINALEDAGYSGQSLNNINCGIYVGFVSEGEYTPLIRNSAGEKNGAQIMVGNGGAFLASRISYFLNLKGPTLQINTACSSSLVAIDQACKSLSCGDTEMMLAGGVLISVTPQRFISAGKTGALSTSGRCRVFDNKADGYVPGEGVGVVVLKSLKKAMKDRDHIYGVIKGSAINQDGTTNGITAPSVESQSQLEQSVYQKYEIDPVTITYVEAHGTGTKLGDPIELTALNDSFSRFTDKKQYCALGSVKSNIGHASAAAGVASVIKTLLMLNHGQIPPSLHYTEANEHINFAQSPFYVNTELRPWKPHNNLPRRAAVSGFGLSGTNCHMVIEEAPKYAEKKPGSIRPCYLIPLSAKSEAALQQKHIDLARWLEGKASEINIEDLSYTLLLGRDHFTRRSAFVVTDINQLKERMAEMISKGTTCDYLISGPDKRTNQPEPALSQFGKGLIKELRDVGTRSDLEYREKFLALADLYVKGYELDWNYLFSERSCYRLSLPAYPFDRKRCWVLDGGKTSPIPAENQTLLETSKLHPFIDRNISNFEEQLFTTRLTGDEFYLTDHVVNGEKVYPVIVTIEMARAAGEIAARKKVTGLKNLIWAHAITVEENKKDIFIHLYPDNKDESKFEITSLDVNDHKVVHSQGTVIFEDRKKEPAKNEFIDIQHIKNQCTHTLTGAELYDIIKKQGIEYGPGLQSVHTLFYGNAISLAKLELSGITRETKDRFVLNPAFIDGMLQTALGVELSEKTQVSDSTYVPFILGEVDIKKELPETCYAYATFAGNKQQTGTSTRKYNIRLLDETGNVLVTLKDFSLKAVDESSKTVTKSVKTFYGKTAWEKWERPHDPIGPKTEHGNLTGHTLIFDTDPSIQTVFTKQLKGESNAVLVQPGKTYRKIDNRNYKINPTSKHDYKKLLEALTSEGLTPRRIIHLWSKEQADLFEKTFELSLTNGVYSLFYLIQSLIESKIKEKIDVLYVYPNDQNQPQPQYAAMSGFARTVRLEKTNLNFKTIEFPTLDQTLLTEQLLFESILDDGIEIRYQGNQRFVKISKLFDLKKEVEGAGSGKGIPTFKEKGVYLISGGAKGLGFAFAELLAKRFNAQLILIGRSQLNEKQNEKIKALETNQAKAVYFQGDVTDKEEMKKIVSQVKSKFKMINGVIHCAGVLRDSLVINKSLADFREVLFPKVYGTICLADVLKNEEMDFFVLFSSVAALFGNAGQVDYTYANSFMDHFAVLQKEHRSHSTKCPKILSINWPMMEDGGMKADDQIEDLYKSAHGIRSLKTETALDILSMGLVYNGNHFFVSRGEPEKMEKILSLDHRTEQTEKTNRGPVSQNDKTEMLGKIQTDLVKDMSVFLKMDEKDIDLTMDLDEYGFDSISLSVFANRISDKYSLPITPAVFFELDELNLESFSCFLFEEHHDSLGLYYRDSEDPVSLSETTDDDLLMKKTENQNSSRQRFDTLRRQEESEKIDHSPETSSVAVIGMSGKMPQSANLEEFWHNLSAEKNLVTEVPKERWDWATLCRDQDIKTGNPTFKWGGFMKDVDNFDAGFFNISPGEAALTDPQQRLLLEIIWETVENAGYKISGLNKRKTGLFVGVNKSDYNDVLRDSGIEPPDNYALQSSHTVIANHIAYILDLRGPCETISTACSSSLVAIHRATEAINNGNCETAIAGGAHCILSLKEHLSFGEKVTLTGNGNCKPFDKAADGIVRGEGVGTILLKPLNKAKEDNDFIHAVIRATGQNNNGHSTSFTAPNPKAQAELIIDVHQKSKTYPLSIGYIEAHATGTNIGDSIEINGLKKAFYELIPKNQTFSGPFCKVGSIKSNIGHLEAAAGIASVIKVLLALKHKTLPGTINFNRLNPYIDLQNSPFDILDKTQKWEYLKDDSGRKAPRRAGVSSFGMTGTNAYVLLEEAEEPDDSSNQDMERPHLILLSAKTEERLKIHTRNLVDFLGKSENEAQNNHRTPELKRLNLENIAYTLQCGREAMNERLAMVVSSIEEMKKELSAYYKGETSKKNVFLGHVTTSRPGPMRQISEFSKGIPQEDELLQIAESWISGSEFEWRSLYRPKSPFRLPLPTYPFLRERHWISNDKEPTGSKSQNRVLKNHNALSKERLKEKSEITDQTSGNIKKQVIHFPDNTDFLSANNILSYDSSDAKIWSQRFKDKMDRGDEIYLLGFQGFMHNSGVSIVTASKKNGIKILANYEEERFIGKKHFAGYPKKSLFEAKKRLNTFGKTTRDIFGVFHGWDVLPLEQIYQKQKSLSLKRAEQGSSQINRTKYLLQHTLSKEAVKDLYNPNRGSIFPYSPLLVRLKQQLFSDLELGDSVPFIQMLHHENHAYFSYGISPFSGVGYKDKSTIVACIDGNGDLSSSSFYKTNNGKLELIKRLEVEDSLGTFYLLLSTFLGGWSPLSAEGRFMGASAWGDNNRLTNPYYSRLKQYFFYSEKGNVHTNPDMVENDHSLLQEIVGPFISIEELWEPDAVLNVDDIQHSKITQDRVDKAAAVQMVFEDALFHLIGSLIRETQSDQLVLCGGTALNCVANMRLLEHFNRKYYQTNFGKDTQLHIWIPPIPSDQGVVVGAPFQFAMRSGAQPPGNLPSPFLCGLPPGRKSILETIKTTDFIKYDNLGNIKNQEIRKEVADKMASIVANNGIIGIFQGEAETGPRALGHRSILANPCNPETLDMLNSRVKFRERIRPLAPMVTLEEAKKWFKLADGASINDYDAYNYMILTAKAKKEAKEIIPAVIHYDGTSRIQIVRENNNLLIYEYLKALKKYIGVEVSVNTSLNVGSPIVQTPDQAVQIFNRAKGLDAIFMISDEGEAYFVRSTESVAQVQKNERRHGPINRTNHSKVAAAVSLQSPQTDNRAPSFTKFHPMIDGDISISGDRFVSRITGEEFYVRDHVVGGHNILPGVVYLEMARAAGSIAGEKSIHKIRNSVWIAPFMFNGSPKELKISLNPAGNDVEYKITSENSNKNIITHAQGKLVYKKTSGADDASKEEIIDIKAIRKRSLYSKDGDECYKMIDDYGTQYGPSFRPLKQLYFGRGEALSYLELPSVVEEEFDRFILHPSIMDGALHSMMGVLNVEGPRSVSPQSKALENHFLPFILGELEIVYPLSLKQYVYITSDKNSENSESGLKKFNIFVLDENGRVLIKIRDFTTKSSKQEIQPKNVPATVPQADKSSRMTDDSHQVTDINEDVLEKISNDLLHMVNSILDTDKSEFTPDSDMGEYGFNSISFTEFVNKMNKKYELDLTPIIMFEHTSLYSLAEHLMEDYKENMLNAYDTVNNNKGVNIKSKSPASANIFDTSNSDDPTERIKTLQPRSTIQPMDDPIAIIGMGGVMPGSENLETFWQNLISGKNLVTEAPIDRWNTGSSEETVGQDTKEEYAKWGSFIGSVDKFDASFFKITPEEAELMDPQQRIFLEIVWKTIEDSGYRASDLSGSKTGIFAGVSSSDYAAIVSHTPSSIYTQTPTGLAHSILANRISFIFNFHGPSEPVDTACSSSLTAIHRAVEAIKSQTCDKAIAGGINLLLNPMIFDINKLDGVLSKDGKCKSFDKEANGWVRGEGAGAVFLKPLSQAELDGDHIYAVIKSTSLNHGGRTNSLTAPNPKAQTELIKNAIQKAGINPNTISYIEAHGTGTGIGDPIEINGLKKAFKELYPTSNSSLVLNKTCGIGSVKTNIGHLAAAAGIAGVIKVLLCMKHKKLPGLLHFNTLNPLIKLEDSPFYIVDKARDWTRLTDDQTGEPVLRRAGISSFGFGGAYAHIILEEYETASSNTASREDKQQMVILSAKNRERLMEAAGNLLTFVRNATATDLANHNGINLSDLSYTLQIGREEMEERLGLVVHSIKELEEKLNRFLEGKEAVDNLFQGRVKRNQKSLLMFEADEDLKTIIDVWIDRGKYARLLDMWVQGLTFDWNRLYSDTQPKRISLPTYPFAGERHWILEAVSKDERGSSHSKNKELSLKKTTNVTEDTPTGQMKWDFIKPGQRNNVKDQIVLNVDEKIELFLKQAVADQIQQPIDQIDKETTFFELGLTSSGVVSFVNEIENVLSAELSSTLLFEHTSIDDLTKYLKEHYYTEFESLSVTKKKIKTEEHTIPVDNGTESRPSNWNSRSVDREDTNKKNIDPTIHKILVNLDNEQLSPEEAELLINEAVSQ